MNAPIPLSLPPLAEIEETFALLDDWEERYAYLLDLARRVPALDERYRVPDFIVPGCTSQVWLVPEMHADKLYFQADSDAQLVRGLIALLLAAYNGQSAAEILRIDLPAAFSRMGLETHLSPNRRNGFFAMIEKIRTLAASAAAV